MAFSNDRLKKVNPMFKILSCIACFGLCKWYGNSKKELPNYKKKCSKLQSEYTQLEKQNGQLQQDLCNETRKLISSEVQSRRVGEVLSKIEKENSLNRISGSSLDDIRNPTEFHSLFSSVDNAIRVYCLKVEKHMVNADKLKHFEEIFKLYDNFNVKNSLAAFIYKYFFLDFENPSFACGGSTIHCEKREETFLKKFINLNDLIEDDDDDEIIDKNEELRAFSHQIQSNLVNQIQNFNTSMAFENAKSILFDSDSMMMAFKHAVQEVWKLHCFSFAFSSPVEIIRTCRNETFKSSECEIASLKKGTKVGDEVQVSFMISPGFKLAKRKNLVVKPLVCLVI